MVRTGELVMQRAEGWSHAHTGRVVHLVGRVSEKTIGFLEPAVDALAQSGVEQVIVLVDDLRYRQMLPRLHVSAQLVLTPTSGSPFKRWMWALEAFREVLGAEPASVVQLHGLAPCLMGLWVARTSGSSVPMHYSPTGSESLGPKIGIARLLRWTVSPRRRRRASSAGAAPAVDRRAANKRAWSHPLTSPVDQAFFDVARSEARHPLIVAGNQFHDPRSIELMAQLAVLLGGEALGLSYNWIGTVDPGSKLRLKAASVGVFVAHTPADRAARLRGGWIYLAPGGTSGFATHLVEAMAAGLPVVALDAPYHRDLIRHGVTGFLCRSEHDFVQFTAALVDSEALRREVGQAAREDMQKRFSELTFRDSLIAAYALPIKTATSEPDAPNNDRGTS